MIEVISSCEKDRLAATVARIRSRNVALNAQLLSEASAIMQEVRLRGDAALVEFAARFDGRALQVGELRVDEGVLRQSAARVSPPVLEAIREAIQRVRAFHKHELERQHSWVVETEPGVQLGQRITAIDRAGLYVPGGTASYPSSVVMNVVPAQIAGVDRVIVATPPRTLQKNPAVAAALVELEVTEVTARGQDHRARQPVRRRREETRFRRGRDRFDRRTKRSSHHRGRHRPGFVHCRRSFGPG